MEKEKGGRVFLSFSKKNSTKINLSKNDIDCLKGPTCKELQNLNPKFQKNLKSCPNLQLHYKSLTYLQLFFCQNLLFK